MKLRTVAACAAVVWLVGCGGDATGGELAAPTSRAPSSGNEREETETDGMQITGLMGTISRRQVEDTLGPRMPRFMRCLEERLGQVEFLAGDIRLGFRIRTDGSVAWVYPQSSSIGDREAEQCVLAVARSARFPRPTGGEAEFAWGFGFEPPDDVRPPLEWGPDAIGRRMNDARSVARECSVQGSFEVTAYIEPGGRVLAAGGSAPNAEAEAALDCILARVRAWTMPDPGSYAAKVTFAVE